MIENKKVTVVLPAYNSINTLEKTVKEIPSLVDEIILVDDASSDNTIKKAKELGLKTFKHEKNKGYGGNQKTCYKKALESHPDIVIMVHPDYQYSPRLVTAMAAMIASGHYDMVLGSRILGDQKSRKEAMPQWRYFANRTLTFIQNLLLNYKLTEYHTGFRGFSRKLLEEIDYTKNSNDFIFDNEIITQAIYFDYKICEISCPTRYTKESSSINLRRSIKYGVGVILTTFKFLIAKSGICRVKLFEK